MGCSDSGSDVAHTPKQDGVTEPISLAGPDQSDRQRTLELEKFLVEAGLYECNEEAIRRQEVLGLLDQIVKNWVKQLTWQRGYTEKLVEEANAVIFTFGSYRLGVDAPGADIDTLCIGPSYVNREEDFFIILHNILAEREEVTELQPIPDAYVPVMKFKFNGISIDLLYASIPLLVVPEDLDISNDSVLHNVDEPTARSLNGRRVADQILRLVPDVENFRTTLRCLKLWAKIRGVYSNEIELNKAHWSALFEPYKFFEAYKNFLQIDIFAANADDMRYWKSWVQSRLRQLTLKIERDTCGMLQCRPYPTEYVDASKRCAHCAFFMGLQRKKGMRVEEGQQFDIRITVREFKYFVDMYMFWKPGMEIYVNHVPWKQIPSFVFPVGYKRTRPLEPSTPPNSEKAYNGEECNGGSSVRMLKRKMPFEENYMSSSPEMSVNPNQLKVSSSPKPCGGSLHKRFKRKMAFESEKHASIRPNQPKIS